MESNQLMNKILLHIGCGNRIHEGFINSDKSFRNVVMTQEQDRITEEMDISKPWPYKDGSVDGIISMQVFQQLVWQDLVFAFRESYRVLKKGGVMRFGTVLLESEKSLDWLLGWNNINLFSFDLLKRVLVDQIGYSEIKERKFRETAIPEFILVDNRHIGKGTFYLEVIK